MATTHRTDRYAAANQPLRRWGTRLLLAGLWVVVLFGAAYLVWLVAGR